MTLFFWYLALALHQPYSNPLSILVSKAWSSIGAGKEQPMSRLEYGSTMIQTIAALARADCKGGGCFSYDSYKKVLPKRKEELFEEEKEQVETKIPADLFEGQGDIME